MRRKPKNRAQISATRVKLMMTGFRPQLSTTQASRNLPTIEAPTMIEVKTKAVVSEKPMRLTTVGMNSWIA